MLKEYLHLHRIDIVCLQETIKQDFSDQELRSLEVGEKFFWWWLPAKGQSGGMLLGFRDSVFEVGRVTLRRYFISTSILSRADRFKMEVVGVYGPADHAFSPHFLQEISDKVSSSEFPILMGGNFNLLRDATDKNNNSINWARMDEFSENIANWGLHEIPRTGARYTWTNKRLNPTRCVLDRVLIAPELEAHFPMCSLAAETSLGSDHTPLILDSRDEVETLTEFWNSLSTRVRGRYILDWWSFMSGGLRQRLKGWSANKKSEVRASKQILLDQIKGLDEKADTVGLDRDEWAFRYHLEEQILLIFRAEEEYWCQRGSGGRTNHPIQTNFHINVVFKFVSKAVATKLDPIANRVISPNQSAFIKGRFILDRVLALHELVHEVKAKKDACVLLKIDFEKAYDRVNLDILTEVLRCKGFDSGVVHRLSQLVAGGRWQSRSMGRLNLSFLTKGECGRVIRYLHSSLTLWRRLSPSS
ncbi:hypothetical protein QYE76_045531 [Lolium multiflorum]|uniref:Reverse transcriptase domain-containing protein n=1 Tax=Lolium multiflorum TaxID=4521 RepID=A0AAD8TN61_LOLMU|nr:hypothetical protein QYE76_045531 [Lolium multiflorum]